MTRNYNANPAQLCALAELAKEFNRKLEEIGVQVSISYDYLHDRPEVLMYCKTEELKQGMPVDMQSSMVAKYEVRDDPDNMFRTYLLNGVAFKVFDK